jgi:hypothetical protein
MKDKTKNFEPTKIAHFLPILVNKRAAVKDPKIPPNERKLAMYDC